MRFYFRDLGVARYFLKAGGIKENAASGYLSENFAYIDLLKKNWNMELSGISPMFGTYKIEEIDFLVGNIINDKTYGIEVKAGKAIEKTVQMLLDDGKVEAVYFLKGDTYGGITDRKITIPIYLVGGLRFDYEREM